MINITYNELIVLKNNNQLIPGQQYRITDYLTTAIKNARSANHMFDIIVVADDVNVLNENARATHHEFDDPNSDEAIYFANSNLAAWELKYCINNDTSKFIWADNSENGRGVIYYMKDEFNNECPYDFKNIQFIRQNIATPTYYTYINEEWVEQDSLLDMYRLFSDDFYCLNTSFNFVFDVNLGSKIYSIEYESNESVWCYTFGKDVDYSLTGNSHDNIIKSNGRNLNNIVLLGESCYNNIFEEDCYDITLGEYCTFNTFGANCYNITLGHNCHHNTFGKECHSNIFGEDCYLNNLGYMCTYNTFSNYCSNNIFGNNCTNNTFGIESCNNVFGYNCNNNTFGNNCCNNTFKTECAFNTFGESIYSPKMYYRNITFDTNNRYINLNCTNTPGSDVGYYQNIKVGMNTNVNSFTTINDNNIGQQYETKIAKNKAGVLKIYCEADLVS